LKKYLFFTLFVFIVFNGCSSKEQEVYNKPAIFWYNKMLKDISTYQLDKADDDITSLMAEHKKSKLIPSALLIMAKVHMDDEEYEMAEFYLDDYIQKYQNDKLIDYVSFLKIKAKYLGFKYRFREQKLLDEAINESEKFIKNFPNSEFLYLVKTIKSRLLMTKANFDLEIASLYKRKNKPKAALYYTEKAKKSWDDLKVVKKAKSPWYRAIFE